MNCGAMRFSTRKIAVLAMPKMVMALILVKGSSDSSLLVIRRYCIGIGTHRRGLQAGSIVQRVGVGDEKTMS